MPSANPAQQRAIEHVSSSLLVLAGAGSGKTRVITRKIARLCRGGLSDDGLMRVITAPLDGRGVDMEPGLAECENARIDRAFDRHAVVGHTGKLPAQLLDDPVLRIDGEPQALPALASDDPAATDLANTNLTGANLMKADLSFADLRQANLSQVNLTLADLSVANLTSANLTGANLTGATLYETNFDQAILHSIQGLDRTKELPKAKNLDKAVR